ncbi:MAG: hypothetical protein OES79_09820 [Planctomycetota bacterium]|nr:hypothetical protein [Planctomycetota bacterium]
MNSEAESATPVFSDHGDPEVAPNRAGGWAVAAFVMGLGSAAALLHPYLWFTAGLGLLVASLALIRLQRAQPPSPAYGLATAGLVLAIIFASWAPTSYYLRRHHLNKQAVAVSQQWLQFLIDGQPYKAFGAMTSPNTRPPLNDKYKKTILDTPATRARFERFQKQKLVTTLTALGPQTNIRHVQSLEQFHRDGADRFVNRFAITDLDNHQKTTIFVRVRAERTANPVTTTGFWRIMGYQREAATR